MGSVDRRVVGIAALLLMVAVLAASMVFTPAALGQGDGIHIVSEEVESHFPDSVAFRLTAASPDPIEEIRVFLKPLGSDRSTYGYLDIEVGKQVTGEHLMTTGLGATHKPPGTVVRYSFEIRDSAGRVLRTEDKEFLYMDNTLEWKEITEGALTVYYYGAFVENRARAVLETARKTMEAMNPVLGIRPTEPIKIVAYSNYRDMARSLPFRAQTVREDLQTEGQAYSTERVLVVLVSGTNFTGVASHEFTHILIGEATGPGYGAVPAWLNEGLAEYGNLDKTPEYDWALNYAVFTRRLRPLWYLDVFGGTPDDIVIGYGHGKSVVGYLIDQYGEGKMAELMKTFQTTPSVDRALARVYGFDQYGLDSQWRTALGLEPFPPPEELAQQIGSSSNVTPAAEPDDTPVPTPAVEVTPEPVMEAAPESPAASDEGRRTSRSCSAPSRTSATLPLDIAVLALLAGPFFALNARWGLGKSQLTNILPLLRRARWGLGRFRGGRSR